MNHAKKSDAFSIHVSDSISPFGNGLNLHTIEGLLKCEVRECIARDPGQALESIGKDLTPEERRECIARAPGQALRSIGKDLTPEERVFCKKRI